jgi:serine-type D-Ala-D-Ala carboxypeptidase (penicillin-binding protein 5/6)
MLGTLLTILAIPFLPFFMYGNAAVNLQSSWDKPSVVLGEAKSKTAEELCEDGASQNFQRPNLFPLGQPLSLGLAPARKMDYGDIKIWSGSSVVIDVDSGTILEYYNGRKQTQIASLTKIMTAVLTIENVKDLDEEVTITPEAYSVSGTVVGCPTSVFCNSERLHIGEKITVRSLLEAMLLDSANDAATALGIHIGGTIDNFISMMNEKAKSLGLKDSNFCTPSGLEIDGREAECYSSAYDIARIAAYSLKYSLIWDIMRITEDRVYSTDKKFAHDLKNTDMLLSEMPECLGGKTGFTPLAGKSLLLAAADPTKKNRIIAVILNDENRWTDMKKLVDWVFDNYEWK